MLKALFNWVEGYLTGMQAPCLFDIYIFSAGIPATHRSTLRMEVDTLTTVMHFFI